jgi:hypothetical protein
MPDIIIDRKVKMFIIVFLTWEWRNNFPSSCGSYYWALNQALCRNLKYHRGGYLRLVFKTVQYGRHRQLWYFYEPSKIISHKIFENIYIRNFLFLFYQM